MSPGAWLVVVAPDAGGTPGTPRAFLARGEQGVNIGRGVWHGVLCPLAQAGTTAPRLFAVVDRIGAGANLVEHWFGDPWTVAAPAPESGPETGPETGPATGPETGPATAAETAAETAAPAGGRR